MIKNDVFDAGSLQQKLLYFYYQLLYNFYFKYLPWLKMDFLNKFYSCICCSSKPKFPDPYQFNFSMSQPYPENNKKFESNYVKTSKYTWYSFLPKSLLIQFKRLANVYFLFIATLQTIPIISPLTPVTAWIPLSVVLTVSILREGYQDYQRYKSDQQMNHELKTLVRRDGRFVQVQWSEVKIGDICQVRQDQMFPADLILLTSCTEDGIAFIQTASLDGQKNLKQRNAHKSTIKYKYQALLDKLEGEWIGRIPDKELHKFSSNMIVGGQTIVYEGDRQFLYRGARLKNTKWIHGLVIYTGRNTKIMMNSESTARKMSQIQIKVNKILIFILLLQFIFCLTISILYGININKKTHISPSSPLNQKSIILDTVLMFFSYYILINSMIPISLIVSMEIVKMSQSYFINKDNLMFSQYRKKGVNVKTASLNEELGQIQYVFTDKTGTLTMNLMEFKIAVIGDKMYGNRELVYNNLMSNTNNSSNDNLEAKDHIIQPGFNDQILHNLVVNRAGDQKLLHPILIAGEKPINISTQLQLCEQFLMALSTAHEVISEIDKQGNMKYQGPSPDEITLVEAAKQMQYQFIKSTQSTTMVKIRGVQKTFNLLGVFPFTSDRKRMSVIIQCEGIIKMYTKGADNIIKQRLAQDSKLNLDLELTRFSKKGLRTLLIGMKTLSKQQYKEFKSNIQSLPQLNRQEKYEELVSNLQRGLYLIGATAVLDRLQDFVPETIRDLIRANIKVWMLTGDKLETAQNIAKSCNLFQNSFTVLKLKNNKPEEVLSQFENLLTYAKVISENHVKKGLLIEGSDLSVIMADEKGQQNLAQLADICEAVVCCRLNPLQKAQLVKIVKHRLNKITLAIGDGANDVPMIKAAHIGIGLFGEQGMSAVQASDYALPQFRMLWRLLLVHGRWNYIRISQMILYFFFKNMLFTFPQFLLAFFCGYSGQSMYDDWYISFYNLVFTSVPLVIRAVLQQDINYVVKKSPVNEQSTTIGHFIRKSNDPVIQRESKYLPSGYEINKYLYRLFPKIYFIGQENCIFNYTNYIMWALEAICQAILITLFSLFILGRGAVNSHGFSNSLWLVGMTIYSSVICIVTFKICTHTKFISKLFIFSVIFMSLILYLVYMWISNYYFTNHIAGTTKVAWTSAKPYFTVFFCICVVLLIDGVVMHFDFKKGGYASKIRQIVDQNWIQSKDHYDAISLKITEGVSESPKSQKILTGEDEINEHNRSK